MKATEHPDGWWSIDIGRHAPAVCIVFEYDAPPRVLWGRIEDRDAVTRWLVNTHPEWLEQVLLPAIGLQADAEESAD